MSGKKRIKGDKPKEEVSGVCFYARHCYDVSVYVDQYVNCVGLVFFF